MAWNSQFEDILAFSGEDYLTIKAVDFPAHLQQAQGFVVGLSGSKVFCLNGNEMTTLDIPLGAPMYQYLDSERYEEAYNIACLGNSVQKVKLFLTLFSFQELLTGIGKN